MKVKHKGTPVKCFKVHAFGKRDYRRLRVCVHNTYTNNKPSSELLLSMQEIIPFGT